LKKEPREERYEIYYLTYDGILLYNNILYIPNSTEIKHLIMDEFHMIPYVGRIGYKKMVTIVIQLY
jgi:hypothetical protein